MKCCEYGPRAMGQISYSITILQAEWLAREKLCSLICKFVNYQVKKCCPYSQHLIFFVVYRWAK